MSYGFLKKRLIVLLVLLSVTLLSRSGYAQERLVAALNNAIIPITTLSPDEEFKDLQPIKSLLNDKRIVGLGEATHGTKEFSLYKDRMIRFLVKELGFKSLIIEADFVGTQVMNDYVLHGKGSAKDALQSMMVGVWLTQEFVDMVEWVRQYNTDKVLAEKVKFYGCDMQFAFNSAALLNKGQIKLKQTLSDQAARGLEIISNWNYSKLNKQDILPLEILAKELREAELEGDDLQLKLLQKQSLETIVQTIEYVKTPRMYDREIVRDKYMASNIEWIANFTVDSKMIVWAHNLHIVKDFTKNNNPPMGSYLARKFSSDYYAFGFGFNSGQLNAFNVTQGKWGIFVIPDVQIKNSSDYIFKQLNKPNFILDFRTAASDPQINTFLNQKIHSRAIGASYNEKEQADGGGGAYQKLSKMYDAIVFIRETNAITFFKRAK